MPRSIAHQTVVGCAITETDAAPISFDVRLLCSVYYFGRQTETAFAELATNLSPFPAGMKVDIATSHAAALTKTPNARSINEQTGGFIWQTIEREIKA